VRLLVCAGGSGGGVYPALSVLQAAQENKLVTETIWIGGEGGMEAALVAREGIPFRAIPAAGVHGVGWRALPGNLLRLARGVLAARRLLRQFRPDVMLFTGGYVAAPVALAARRIPSLLYVPDIEPGLTLKTLSRFADRICLIAETSRQYFPRRARLSVTGHPTRRGLADWTQAGARQALGLHASPEVLLVFGGSKGARSINRAVIASLPQLLPSMQILHLTGALDWEEVQSAARTLPPELAARYRAHPYLHEQMGAAYAAADVILSRAGASAVGEFPLFGKPAILAPYPHAWRYQKVNADYLAGSGAALLLPDERLNADLTTAVLDLMRDEPRRRRMASSMRDLARPDAAAKIAGELHALAVGTR
jgi:UDP-N-acetylglucosamine--N-acetylmuramyl-(pentapeptide) pyrophosphoryl-undecaprenol N-acetylglucosamine transferase